MKLAICNEFCEGWSLDDTCRLAAEVGCTGIEIAPFTLNKDATKITESQKQEVRDAAKKHGLEVVGLHWLLAMTEGLYINHPDDQMRQRTKDYFLALINLCEELGGDKMIFGSPYQRNVIEGETFEATYERTLDFFNSVVPAAGDAGVTICMEPLARTETNFIINKDEGIKLIDDINHPAFRLLLDCKAMSDEERPAEDLIREANEYIAHFHVNDDNLSYPGSGSLDFVATMKALLDINYQGWVSLEVFDFSPGAETIAREGIGHIKESIAKASA